MKRLFAALMATTIIFLTWRGTVAKQSPAATPIHSSMIFPVTIQVRVAERKTGKEFTGLKAVDFNVFAGDAQLNLTSVEHKRSSLALLYLINIDDEFGAVAFTPKAREITNHAIKTLEEEDRFAAFQLVRGGRSKKLLGFEENRILPELDYRDEPAAEFKKRYSYYEPLKEVIAYLNANAGTKRKVLLVTDGSGVLLYPAPPYDKPAQEIYELFLRSGIEVYWLSHNMGFVHAFTGKKSSCCNWNEFSFAKFDSKILAALTGGEMIYSGTKKPAIGKVIQNLRHSYELSFQPPASLATGTPQLIEVKLAPHLKHREKEWRVIAPRAVLVPKPQEKR